MGVKTRFCCNWPTAGFDRELGYIYLIRVLASTVAASVVGRVTRTCSQTFSVVTPDGEICCDLRVYSTSLAD